MKDQASLPFSQANVIAFVLALLGLFLCLNELNAFYNYSNPTSLFLVSTVLGSLLGFTLLYFAFKINIATIRSNAQYRSVVVLVWIGTVAFTTAIISKVNRSQEVANSSCFDDYQLIRKSQEKVYRQNQHRILVQRGPEQQEIVIEAGVWSTLQEGQSLSICNPSGMFGFDFWLLP